MASSPASKLFPSRPVDVSPSPVAVHEGAPYYSEVKNGSWKLAQPADLKALKRGDRVAIAGQHYVYTYLRWDSVEAEAVVQFIGYNFRTRIPVKGLQVEKSFNSQNGETERAIALVEPKFQVGDRVETDYSNYHSKTSPPGLMGVDHGQQGTVKKIRIYKEKYVGYQVSFQGFHRVVEVPEQFLRPTSEALGELIDEIDRLLNPSSKPIDTLITEINALYGQIEEAEEVAISAARSALVFAREMGEKLLQAKKECGHGNWEDWRKKIVSPRSGKTMPSSTATLYQRIAKRWKEVEQAQTVREAAALLKGDRVSSEVSSGLAETKPTYRVPDGVLRLENVEGGFELHGLVLSQERFAKLAALSRSLDGTLSTALFQLIDQLPEVPR